jgi:23S rRNA (guanosine2251-2'-O)-methyltransferase
LRTRRPEQPGDGNKRPGKHANRRAGSRPTEHRPRTAADRQLDYLYGRNAVRESLRAARRRFSTLLVAVGTEDQERVADILTLAWSRSVPVEPVAREKLDGLVQGHHQGVVLQAGAYPYANDVDLNMLVTTSATILALDGIVDPQNVGTLLRTAEATGVGLVVIPEDRAAHVTPAVVNASAGAVEHLRITREVNLVRWLDRARTAGYWVVGLAGEEGATPMYDASMAAPIVLVVGSEGGGLRRLVREHCDLLVSLPMKGAVESLNAAVAGSIGLYEILRDSSAD